MELGKKQTYIIWGSRVLLLCIILFSLVYIFSFRAPENFPAGTVVNMPQGASLTTISHTLEDEHVIRSPFWFTNLILFLHHEHSVVGGTYYFDKPLSVVEVAKRLSAGTFNIGQLKTTIPEGSTVFDISQIIKSHYPTFDDIHFLTIAKEKEGYLFPDTYKFGASVTPEQVVSIMNSTFEKKISDPTLQQEITASGRPLQDVITMASILEGEARQMQTRRIVAGILWKRIDMGIPLQVDSAFRYVNGKTTNELTAADLKIDSPYNTYLYKGLPPTPISNPGLDSITAALTPIQTDYLYFLTDKQGNMHYATTLEQHDENKAKYLK